MNNPKCKLENRPNENSIKENKQFRNKLKEV